MTETSETSPLKAALRIRLYAGDVEVAESDDAALWQRTLSSITGAKVPPPAAPAAFVSTLATTPAYGGTMPSDAVERFAAEIDLPVEQLIGALSPSNEDPFIHLDSRTWEAFKKNFPPRGPGAVAPVVLAGTALVFWFRAAQLGRQPRQVEAAKVLDTIHVRDKNPSRGIKNCEWLQSRGGELVLNPARVSAAAACLKAFCLRQRPAAELGQ